MPSEAFITKNVLLAYPDAYAQELLNQTQEDAMLGRMSAPWKIEGGWRLGSQIREGSRRQRYD